jgi:hypothetical protein
MRRNRTTTPTLTGQLLFAEVDAGSITLDCVLARAGSGAAAIPVTLRAQWPARAKVGHITSLLQDWAGEEAEIDVTITDGPRGPQVEIACAATKVVLEPEG